MRYKHFILLCTICYILYYHELHHQKNNDFFLRKKNMQSTL